MLSLNTNVASLSTQKSLAQTQKALTTSMSRLGTGYRVNSAMDDAAGLQIATRLDSQSRGMAVAQRNTQNGISMLQTAEGAFNELTDILQRMKDLATEASNGTATVNDQTAMQSEYTSLGDELKNIMTNTTFGGQTLLKGGTLAGSVTFQIGASSSETMTLNLTTDMTALDTALQGASCQYKGVAVKDISDNGGTPSASVGATNANATIGTLSTALDALGTVRSELGAAANRLDHVNNNLANIRANTDAAKGRIMDVDYATETANMTAKQMLMQAGTSMLKQSSSMSQMVMSLLQ